MISKFIKGLVILATLSLAGCFSNAPPDDVLAAAVSTPNSGYGPNSGWKLVSVKTTNSYDSVVNSETIQTIEYTADFRQVSGQDQGIDADGKTHHKIIGRVGLAKRGNSWYMVVPSQMLNEFVYHDK